MEALREISPYVYKCGITVRNINKIPYTISAECCNVFIFVKSGSLIHEVGGRKRILKKGSLEIIPPFSHQIIYAPNKEISELNYIYFDLIQREEAWQFTDRKPALTSAPPAEYFFADKPCFKDGEKYYDEIKELIEKISSSLAKAGKFGALERKMYMLNLIMLFLKSEVAENEITVKQKDDHVFKAIRYINTFCYDNKLCAKTVADHMRLSTDYLSRLFVHQIHMSLSDYIRAARIKRAKELFVNERNVTEVARKCGFSSVQSFRRTFKAREGRTPGEYLK